MGRSNTVVEDGMDGQLRTGSFAMTRQPLLGLTLALIILLNVGGALYWMNRNVVLVGNDASGYLDTTFEYARFFTHLSPETIFKAFTYPDYRTSGLFVAVLPFYALFGVNMDSAQLVNVVGLALLIWACFELGRYAVGPGVGLISALLIGLFPMIMAMSRLFYAELLVATFVAINLLALVKSDGFRHRAASLLWGASLGIGLLVKWALPIYILAPTIWIIWQSKLLQANAQSVRRFRLDWRALLLAVVVSLGLTLLWFLPNRTALQSYLLGDLHFVAWFVIGTLWIYSLAKSGGQTGNWWAGVWTAVVIASLWYLPHVDFLSQLAAAEQTRGDAGATPFNVFNYTRYFQFFYDFHLGALATWVIVPIALFPWLRALWTRRPVQANSAIFWLSLLSTYSVLLLLSQSSPRFLVPMLPAVVVLAAISLWQYTRPWRLVFGMVWAAVLIFQWSLFTFDVLSPITAQTQSLWTVRAYAVPPRSLETDIGYWIGPDVLDQMEAIQHPEVQRLGMLSNSPQLHRGILKYIISSEQRSQEIQTLTETDSPGWSGVLGSQWLLLKDGDNRDVEAPGLALIDRILAGDPLFDALYAEVARYPLPNGETAFLYHRALGPGRPLDLPLTLEQTQVVADFIRQAWSEYASLVYVDPGLAVWVGIHDPARERIAVLDGDGALDVERLSALRDTVIVVWDHTAQNLGAWMDEHAYRAVEVGDDFASAAIYGRPTLPLTPMTGASGEWPAVQLAALRTHPAVAPGQVLPVEIEMAIGAGAERKLSLRLLNKEGEVVASNDRVLAPSDRLGLFVPPTSPAGEYHVAALLYDPMTLEVVQAVDGGDLVELTTIRVEP